MFLGDADEALHAPRNKHLRIENKNFYFDVRRNQQGRYMAISEVSLVNYINQFSISMYFKGIVKLLFYFSYLHSSSINYVK